MVRSHEMAGDMKGAELIEGIKRSEPSDEHWRRAIALSENISNDFQNVLDDTLGALRYELTETPLTPRRLLNAIERARAPAPSSAGDA